MSVIQLADYRRQQRHLVIPWPAATHAGPRALIVFGAALVAIVVDAVSSTVFNAWLPYLQGEVGATPDEGSWLLTAFNAPYYTCILFSVWLIARYGRKPVLVSALFGVAAAYIASMIATGYWPEIVLRVIGGACCGCVFVSAAYLLLTTINPKLMSVAILMFTLVVLCTPLIGPLLGGWLSENVADNAALLPVALAAIVAALVILALAIDGPEPRTYLQADIVGVALSLLVFGSMQYLANEGERRNWFDDPAVTLAFVMLMVSLPAFVLWEMRLTPMPHVNFRVLKIRGLLVGTALSTLLGVISSSTNVFLQFGTQVLGFSPTVGGQVIAVRLIAYVLFVPLSWFLITRKFIELSVIQSIAFIAMAFAFITFSFRLTPAADVTSYIAVSLALAATLAVATQPVTMLIFASAQGGALAAAAALYKLSTPVGTMIGSAWTSTMLDHRVAVHLSDLAGEATLANPGVSAFLTTGGRLSALAHLVQAEALSLATSDTFIAIGLVALLALPITALRFFPRPRSN